MKNAKVILLSTLTVLIAGITGIFVGRNIPDNRAALSGNMLQPTIESIAQQPSDNEASQTVATSETAINRININTATKEQLMLLPGIGQTLADRIITYRQQNGAFKSTAELELVKGIGNKTLLKILDYITVGG